MNALEVSQLSLDAWNRHDPNAIAAQVEGDKIRSEHVYLDRQTVAEQLGLTPKKT